MRRLSIIPRHLIWILTLAPACDQEVRTEHRQIRVITELQSYSGFATSLAALEGSTVCLDYTGYRASTSEPVVFTDATSEELAACYDEQVSGPATFSADRCMRLDAAGLVVWSASRRACGIDGDFEDDEVHIDAVALGDALGAFAYAAPSWRDFGDLELELADLYTTPPAGFLAGVGEPIYIIEDSLTSVSTAVRHRDDLRQVAVSDAWVSGVAIAGTPTFPEATEPSLELSVDAKADDVFSVTLHLPTGELEAGQVQVVSRQAVASLSLHPDFARLAGSDVFFQVGAQAIARDAEGRVLREPPVTWTVREGDVELETFGDGDSRPAYYASILGACEGAEAGEERSALLEGRLDSFTESVHVDWTCVGPQDEACSCRTDGNRPSLAWIFGMVVLGATGRRRTS